VSSPVEKGPTCAGPKATHLASFAGAWRSEIPAELSRVESVGELVGDEDRLVGEPAHFALRLSERAA
jgi:hypothetical protein